MSREYAKRLEEVSQTNGDVYQKILVDCQNDIIENIGGLNTMIQLCLTHDQFCTDTYESQFDSFRNLMESKLEHLESKESQDTIQMRDDDYNDIYPNHTPITIDQNVCRKTIANKKTTKTIVPNLEEFYRHSIAMVAYCSDNLYFVYLSKENAKYICYHILHTKIYPIIMITIGILFAFCGQVSWIVSGYSVMYHLLSSISYFAAIVFSISYILSTNISIVTFIIQTFDFWYKMYNLVIWIITLYFVDRGSSIAYFILSSIVLVCVYLFLFILDATSISTKFKNMCIILVVLYGTYVCLFVYFFADDTQWNPFKKYNFEFTNVSFKSLFIGSQSNLCLFILKPILSQIVRKMRKCAIHKQKNKKEEKNYNTIASTINKHNDDIRQRSYVLYKRPYVHWTKDSRNAGLNFGDDRVHVSAVRVSSLSPTPIPSPDSSKMKRDTGVQLTDI